MMSRWQAGLILMVPALIIIAGIVLLLIYPGTSQTAGDTSICTESEPLTAPSGRSLSLCETLSEVQPSGEVWSVIRVHDPALPGAGGATTQGDHDWACETWGLASLDVVPRPVRIIVQVMAMPFERGEPSPGITQSIEAYSESNGTCMWELL